MYLNQLLAVGAITTAFTAAVSVPHKHILHEKRDATPHGWVKRDPVQGHVELPFRVGMTQQNLDRGEELLMDVSSHDSPNFGKWYTAEQIHDLFAPSNETVHAITEWLKSAGIEAHQSVNKQWMQFDIPTEKANELLKTTFHVFEHEPSGKAHVGCDEYHVPHHVRRHVDYITPGVKLLHGGKKKRMTKKEALEKRIKLPVLPPITKVLPGGLPTKGQELAACKTAITPPCIAAEYKISQATKAHKGNELGIFEEGDFYAAEDLALFFAALAENIPVDTEPILKGVDGGFAPGAVATGESDLDFQISYPIIYPQQSVLFQTDDVLYSAGIEGKGGFLNTFLDAIDGSYCKFQGGDSNLDPKYPDPIPIGYQGKTQCGVYKPTNVISISYGEQEPDLPTAYQTRQCAEFMKLGMQGVSVIIASGDSGVAARSADAGNSDGCIGSGASKGKVFNPDFPASCPYVTALGATVLVGDVNKDQEVATSSFPSGGGFSNIYKRPAYQDKAVTRFFGRPRGPKYPYYSTSGQNNPGPSITGNGIYNRAGRGYPDFAAVGDNVVIFLDGTPMLIGGTSAAAPVFAAILNRINEERLAKGKSTVGFVNPTLYAHPEVLHDIRNGTNPGCNTQGFSCTVGWDPVTGLGTPQYDKMLALYMSLP